MSWEKAGFGGGCHWCTEAYFTNLLGVKKVEQGWISAAAPNDGPSEAVIVHYDALRIPLSVLIAIHLHSHSSTSRHKLREKYRSAVYVFDAGLIGPVQKMIAACASDFDEPIVTEVLEFRSFESNTERYQDYYRKNKGSAFCERYIQPKLLSLQSQYAAYFNAT